MEQIPVFTISARDWAEMNKEKLESYTPVLVSTSYITNESNFIGKGFLEDQLRDSIPTSMDREKIRAIVDYQFSISNFENMNTLYCVAGTALVRD